MDPRMITPARTPFRRRRPRRLRRRRTFETGLALPSPPTGDVPLEPGGMVEVALNELGARLVRVQQEPTSDS
jgi:hypothetical protein